MGAARDRETRERGREASIDNDDDDEVGGLVFVFSCVLRMQLEEILVEKILCIYFLLVFVLSLLRGRTPRSESLPRPVRACARARASAFVCVCERERGRERKKETGGHEEREIRLKSAICLSCVSFGLLIISKKIGRARIIETMAARMTPPPLAVRSRRARDMYVRMMAVAAMTMLISIYVDCTGAVAGETHDVSAREYVPPPTVPHRFCETWMPGVSRRCCAALSAVYEVPKLLSSGGVPGSRRRLPEVLPEVDESDMLPLVIDGLTDELQGGALSTHFLSELAYASGKRLPFDVGHFNHCKVRAHGDGLGVADRSPYFRMPSLPSNVRDVATDEAMPPASI